MLANVSLVGSLDSEKRVIDVYHSQANATNILTGRVSLKR